VEVRARVAFAAETPRDTAYAHVLPGQPRRLVGDTVTLHGERREGDLLPRGSPRRVELIVNGDVAAAQDVPADDEIHDLLFRVPVVRSSWMALRQFPQLHTNPVDVLIGGGPIRVSRNSALWCVGAIEQLWRARHAQIAAKEREEARRTFDQAIEYYQRVASEAPDLGGPPVLSTRLE
jgi:hypothetical protein